MDFTYAPTSPQVAAAFRRGVIEITRRVEIYEADGETRWYSFPAETVEKFTEGSITVDYGSAERRKLDVTFENVDKRLRPAPGGFYYDKVIKAFRGIRFPAVNVSPRAVLIEAPNDSAVNRTRAFFSSIGFTDTDVKLGVTSYAEIKNFDFIFAYSGSGATTVSDILKQAYADGKRVVTVGSGSTNVEIPLYTSSGSLTGDVSWGLTPGTGDYPGAGAFGSQTIAGAYPGTRVNNAAPGVARIATWVPVSNQPTITAAYGTNANGGKWFDLHLPVYDGTQTRLLARAVLTAMRGITTHIEWEVQVGEFVVADWSADHFPGVLKVVGLDYSRKLMKDKIHSNMSFPVGTKLLDFVSQIAAGPDPEYYVINPKKFKFNIGDEVLASEMSFEADTDRWTIIAKALEAFSYEMFFDAYGFFVIRKFNDPATAPPFWEFKIGEDGDLVSYSESGNDSEIYNDVIVIGEPADGAELLIPYFGRATNRDADSPTSVQKLGFRTKTIKTNWLSSDAEALQLAANTLKISALEPYELGFESIVYPWMEVGEIVDVQREGTYDFEPTRFLLDSITIPLGLGAMSAGGKRVILIDSSGT